MYILIVINKQKNIPKSRGQIVSSVVNSAISHSLFLSVTPPPPNFLGSRLFLRLCEGATLPPNADSLPTPSPPPAEVGDYAGFCHTTSHAVTSPLTTGAQK